MFEQFELTFNHIVIYETKQKPHFKKGSKHEHTNVIVNYPTTRHLYCDTILRSKPTAKGSLILTTFYQSDICWSQDCEDRVYTTN